ncbi:aldose 1-epimerase family protein [Nitratireductor sp. StC3]|uniref:aldose 1-epimerase family protein n=1 Tax=Nitratireductor sp. StC3 TaxID=2126741 RepID=UPI000D0DFECE|nr:aldose 1-epimerase family protein [Nitratireductor sp. StC3]PSM18475.1 aldose epimerase [Nitratireductor sp. StC3]
MSEEAVLRSGTSRLRIRRRGAEVVAWRVGPDELVWSAGPQWPRSSPLLFPVVGRVKDGMIRVDGRRYPMPTHGFAAGQDFVPVERTETTLRLRLRDNDETRAAYPFAFCLEVFYRLGERAVEAVFTLTNPGSGPLPYALGLHPGFRWPFADGEPEDYRILFESAEQASVPAIDPDGLFTEARRALPLEGRDLPLAGDLMAREALCFLDARSRGLRFVSPGGAAIAVETEGFAHFALWARPPARFLCIEAWTGHGDPSGFAGELAQKPSMVFLAPGGDARHIMRWRFEAGSA